MGFDFQAAYDKLDPADRDYRFYAALAASACASSDVDLGCGTGTLALMLASAGASVTGVDPNLEMLRTVETPSGAVEFWHETAAVDLPLVSYDTLTRNLRTGEATTSRDVLAFRDERALRASLEHAGFTADHVYGDWDRSPVTAASPELIVIARSLARPASSAGGG